MADLIVQYLLFVVYHVTVYIPAVQMQLVSKRDSVDVVVNLFDHSRRFPLCQSSDSRRTTSTYYLIRLLTISHTNRVFSDFFFQLLYLAFQTRLYKYVRVGRSGSTAAISSKQWE